MANEEIREIKGWMIHSGLGIERYWNVIIGDKRWKGAYNAEMCDGT
jgi:hypothetical protein